MQFSRNFSIAMVWINGGSNLDGKGKKGLNQILCSLLKRGCKGFENLEFSEYIDSHGAELNLETLEDGMLISLKSLDEHFYKLFPLLDLIINNPLLLESQFQKLMIIYIFLELRTEISLNLVYYLGVNNKELL